jgi:hypothetical protein
MVAPVEGEGLSRGRERALCELPDRDNTANIPFYRPIGDKGFVSS